ncbi:MAG: TrkA family potassium uptake protein [Planctomycetota bacterium]
MNVLIAGGGKTLYFLCRTFLAKGHDVTVINRDREECVELSKRLKISVVQGDASDPVILEEAGAHAADAVLAVTPHDQDNLAICQLARIQFDAPRAVALANDPDNEDVFTKLGVTAFSTTRVITSLIEQRTVLDDVVNLVPVGEGKVNITEIVLSDDSPAAGKVLRDLELPEGSLVAVVLRDDETVVPGGATKLRTGDRIVLITLPGNHGPALRAITGEKA